MKIFFDTNVYVAESLVGEGAVAILEATERAGWRIFTNDYVLDELKRVLVEYRRFPLAFANRSCRHVARRAKMVEPITSRHQVPNDPNDTPILAAAIAASVDYLVTNDQELLALDPYEGVRIISMTSYFSLLENEGLLPAAE
jgi:putative PIN family toxin of toxin-antitoxin system